MLALNADTAGPTGGYGSMAKFLHWAVAAILLAQFLLGSLMPEVRRGMQPGFAMHAHISMGLVALGLIVVRLAWRITHPVPPAASLTAWQRNASIAVHWLLYALVFAATLSGWFYASMRGWPLTFFGLFPLPALVAQGSTLGRALGRMHESVVWILVAVVVIHVIAALVHAFVYRDHVMRRMLFIRNPAAGRIPAGSSGP